MDFEKLYEDHKRLFTRSTVFMNCIRTFLFILIIAFGVIKINQNREDRQTHQSEYAVITMQDFGYDESYIQDAYLNEESEVGRKYELSISNLENQEEEEYFHLDMMIIDVNDKIDPHDFLKDEMLTKKKSSKPSCGPGCIDLVKDSWNKENIEEFYVDVSESFPSADVAYSLYEMNYYPGNAYYQNYLFLQKNSRIVMFAHPTSGQFILDDTGLSVIEGLLTAQIK